MRAFFARMIDSPLEPQKGVIMPCYRPLQAYKSHGKKTDNGKTYITFNLADAGDLYSHIELPCGQCIGCRIERSKQWALRCVHEASLYDNNCFITLTFNDENLNVQRSLVKADFQKFMKRLRKRFSGLESVQKSDGSYHSPIRYFHCGEYGTELQRPHHHACLFNFDFLDRYHWATRNGVQLFRSAELEDLWPYGFCTVGNVTFQSAAYVARYITKKITGEKAKKHYLSVDKDTGETYSMLSEYITMSRRPGIGKRWLKTYQKDVYPSDFITHDGKKFRPPAYYDKIYDLDFPSDMSLIKKQRLKSLIKHKDNNTPRRRVAREKVQLSKCKQLVRSYEDAN